MLLRNVLINGIMYSAHVVAGISIINGAKIISVYSYKTEADVDLPMSNYVARTYSMQTNTDDEYTQAYSYISELKDFEEYHDVLEEVLDILTDEQAEQVPDAFPEWKPNVAYVIGDRRRYLNSLYKCLQNHISQEGYEPSVAVSLWARIGEPGEIPDWEQPSSTNPYMKGDLVRHNGKIWESLVDNNVWEPGTPGTEVLWEEVQL